MLPYVDLALGIPCMKSYRVLFSGSLRIWAWVDLAIEVTPTLRIDSWCSTCRFFAEGKIPLSVFRTG
jgi:hypothetical protein